MRKHMKIMILEKKIKDLFSPLYSMLSSTNVEFNINYSEIEPIFSVLEKYFQLL